MGDVVLGSRYRVDALLGQGTVAQVYRVRHLDLDTERILKVVSQDRLGTDPGLWAECHSLFELEAQVAAQVESDHVLRVHDFQQVEDRLYLVVEYAPGGSLARRLREGLLPVEQAVSITRDIAAGLEALHKQRVIHCHVTPSNILLDSDDGAKVAGLGGSQSPWNSAYRTPRQSQLLSESCLSYQSPEQTQGVAYLTPSSDVYALGCVLFEMLTGQRWSDVRGTAQRVRDLRPEVSPQLDTVLERMLREERGRKATDASDPRKRYPTMGAVLDALPATLPLTARPSRRRTNTEIRQPPRVGARIALTCLAIAVLVALAALLVRFGAGQTTDMLSARVSQIRAALNAVAAVAPDGATGSAVANASPGSSPSATAGQTGELSSGPVPPIATVTAVSSPAVTDTVAASTWSVTAARPLNAASPPVTASGGPAPASSASRPANIATPTTAASPPGTPKSPGRNTPTPSPEATSTPCVNDAAFVADLTVPDNTLLETDKGFDKAWQVRNSGSCPWTAGYRLVFAAGDRLSVSDSQALTTTLPGRTVEVAMAMTAPPQAGSYRGEWRFVDARGKPFGQKLTVVIQVRPPTPSPTPSATPSSTRTLTPVPSPTPTDTETPTREPTATPSATATARPSATPKSTTPPVPEPSATRQLGSVPTPLPSVAPSATDTATAAPTATPSPTDTATAAPTATPSPTEHRHRHADGHTHSHGHRHRHADGHAHSHGHRHRHADGHTHSHGHRHRPAHSNVKPHRHGHTAAHRDARADRHRDVNRDLEPNSD